MRLARDERRDMVRMLADEGMSTRAIAPIVGASQKTVDRDIRDSPTESNDSDEPRAVLGNDGRTLPAHRHPSRKCPSRAAVSPVVNEAPVACPTVEPHQVIGNSDQP